MKITRHILFLLIVSGLLGQIEEEKKPKTFLFGLIKIKSNSPYEKGAWIDKWIHAREFALPVYFAPIEVRYGFGFNGKTSGSLHHRKFKSPHSQYQAWTTGYIEGSGNRLWW